MHQPESNSINVRYFYRYLIGDRRFFWFSLPLMMVSASVPVLTALIPKLIGTYWQPQATSKLCTLLDQWVITFGLEPWHCVTYGLAGISCIFIVAIVCQLLGNYWLSKFQEGFVKRIRLALFEKIGKLPSQAMNFQSVGTLTQRISQDVMRLGRLLNNIPMLLINSLMLLYSLIVLGSNDFYLLLLALATIATVFGIVKLVNLRVTKGARKIQQHNETLLTRFIEGINGYRDLVSSGRYDSAVQKFEKLLIRLREQIIRTSFLGSFSIITPLLLGNGLVFGFYFMSLTPETMGDQAAIGTMISSATLLLMLPGPVMQIAGYRRDIALALPSFQMLYKLLDAEEIQDHGTQFDIPDAEIVFEDVSFSYGSGQPLILNKLNWIIPAGCFTAIVGESGSGKTTLFHLLLRLIEPSQGMIRIGDHPITDFDLLSLRQHLGYIPQSPFMFDGSIRENIFLGASDQSINENKLEQTIQLAGLDTLIEKRSHQGGIDAPVGPGGASLSGGERQRIALARLFINDPEIIVCDEYTANIDSTTAMLIHETLKNKFSDKTRIVITHQLYSIRGAEQIILLKDGGCVGMGTHEELKSTSDLYRNIWSAQQLN